MNPDVIDNTERHRLELRMDGHLAHLPEAVAGPLKQAHAAVKGMIPEPTAVEPSPLERLTSATKPLRMPRDTQH